MQGSISSANQPNACSARARQTYLVHQLYCREPTSLYGTPPKTLSPSPSLDFQGIGAFSLGCTWTAKAIEYTVTHGNEKILDAKKKLLAIHNDGTLVRRTQRRFGAI